MENFNFDGIIFRLKKGVCFFLVLIGKKAGVAKILRSFSKLLKAGIDLLIMARPTLDSREVLTRIAQKETRQVMV